MDPSDAPPAAPLPRMSGPLFGLFVFLLTAAVSLATGCRFEQPGIDREQIDDPFEMQHPRELGSASVLTPDERRNIDIFRRVSPSVVNVTATGVEVSPQRLPRADQTVGVGMGSGFIWSDRGYIVTNMHVVDQHAGATVSLSDGSTWEALYVGYEAAYDLAVLAIEAPREKLVPIQIGRSSDLIVGQKVYAIGNPFGLDHTLTVGVVSGLARRIQAYNQQEIDGVHECRRLLQNTPRLFRLALAVEVPVDPRRVGSGIARIQ